MSVKILHGDCRELLKTLPDKSVHMCCTSPPYWGLRSYLPPDHPEKHKEIGSEPTVHEWVRTMVEVLREVRRVLRDDGTLWLNLGDSYAGSRCGGSAKLHQRTSRNLGGGPQTENLLVPRSDVLVPGLKPKDMVGQPWRVAFALQADGWWLRQEIIWGKKNPMPESCRDRFTRAHEHVFLLAKSGNPTIWRARDTGEWSNAPDLTERLHEPADEDQPATVPRWRAHDYYFDIDAVQEPASENTHQRRAGTGVGFGHGYDAEEKPRARVKDALPQGVGRRQGPPGNPAERPISPKAQTARASALAEVQAGAYVDGKSERLGRGPGWRNKQNASFDEAMAVMPATRNPRSVRMLASEPFRGAHFATYPPALIEPFILAGCPEGGTVLDPFGGSGTTGLVCDRLGRNAILIDLDERNAPMAQRRLAADRGSVHRQLPIPLEAA